MDEKEVNEEEEVDDYEEVDEGEEWKWMRWIGSG